MESFPVSPLSPVVDTPTSVSPSLPVTETQGDELIIAMSHRKPVNIISWSQHKPPMVNTRLVKRQNFTHPEVTLASPSSAGCCRSTGHQWLSGGSQQYRQIIRTTKSQSLLRQASYLAKPDLRDKPFGNQTDLQRDILSSW